MDVQLPEPAAPAPETPTPKYWRIQQAIQRLVERESLRPGDRLPTEPELQRRFGASRGTVRRAFDDLERMGLVSRQPGRGTFVARRRMPRPLPELTSFTEHLRSLGFAPGARFVSYREVGAGSDVAHAFPAGAELVRIVRVRTADGMPVGLHTLFLPVELARRVGFTAAALRAAPDLSLYRSLEATGVAIEGAREELVARLATGREAALLGVRRPAAVLEVTRRTVDAVGQPVELVRAVYRGDRYDYVVWLRRRAGAGGDEAGLRPLSRGDQAESEGREGDR
jgi:GntR family transcriptional regulator